MEIYLFFAGLCMLLAMCNPFGPPLAQRCGSASNTERSPSMPLHRGEKTFKTVAFSTSHAEASLCVETYRGSMTPRSPEHGCLRKVPSLEPNCLPRTRQVCKQILGETLLCLSLLLCFSEFISQNTQFYSGLVLNCWNLMVASTGGHALKARPIPLLMPSTLPLHRLNLPATNLVLLNWQKILLLLNPSSCFNAKNLNFLPPLPSKT